MSMGNCICAGAYNRGWEDHSDYCPAYMAGRIAQLEAENVEIRRQHTQMSMWKDKLEAENNALQHADPAARRTMERNKQLEAQVKRVEALPQYTVFECIGGCEIRERPGGGLIKKRELDKALEKDDDL